MSGQRVILLMAALLALIVIVAIVAASCLETPQLREGASVSRSTASAHAPVAPPHAQRLDTTPPPP